MSDRELLALAATAMQQAKHPNFVNFTVVDDIGVCLDLGSRWGAITSYWKPLHDDGDALRLAVRLKIDIKQYDDHVVGWFDGGYIGTGKVMYEGDPFAATRRAIVLAAAALVKPKIHYDDLTGDDCSVCGAPQFISASGITCRNGHGGAEAQEIE